jgi:hypothetical protein
MQVANRQRQELAECPRILDDAKNSPRRAVAAEAALAPITVPAREVDFADYSLPDPRFVAGVRYFADEFVAGRARESVVSALKLKICRADPRGKQTNPGETFWDTGQRDLAKLHAPGATSMTSLEMNS